jgi:hypothetical protein
MADLRCLRVGVEWVEASAVVCSVALWVGAVDEAVAVVVFPVSADFFDCAAQGAAIIALTTDPRTGVS